MLNNVSEAAEVMRTEAGKFYGVELSAEDLPDPTSVTPDQYMHLCQQRALQRRVVQLAKELTDEELESLSETELYAKAEWEAQERATRTRRVKEAGEKGDTDTPWEMGQEHLERKAEKTRRERQAALREKLAVNLGGKTVADLQKEGVDTDELLISALRNAPGPGGRESE